MNDTLIIISSREEAEYFFERSGRVTAQAKVLALLPEAQAYLKDKNIPHENTLNYFTRQSHERGLKAIDDIVVKIDQSVVIRDDNGLSHTYTNILTFYLRLYVGYIISTLETLMNFMEEHDIKNVEVCRYDKQTAGGWEIAAQEGILSQVVELVARSMPVPVRTHTIQRKNSLSSLDEWSKRVYRALFNRMALIFFKRPARPMVLFYGLKFNFDQLAKALAPVDVYNLVPEQGKKFQFTESKNGMPIQNLHLDYLWPRQDRQLNDALSRMSDVLSQRHQQEKLFVYRGVDFSGMVMAKVKTDFANGLKILNRKVRSLKRTMEAIRPSLVVSPMARELSFALGEVSRQLGIPSVLISHGSHVPPRNEYSRMEWMDHGKGLIDTEYQYHLLQSPWAVQYVESLAIKKDYYRIMPLIFPKVDRSKKAEKQLSMYPASAGKKIIVHASTPKAQGSNRLYIYETLDEYIQNMIDLIGAVKNMPDVFLVIRFRPSKYLRTEDLKKLLPVSDHYTIATEGSFNDYLTIADLIISFSSTTIEEALINHIAVLQYDRTGRYQHMEGAQWAQGRFSQVDSVYFVGNEKDLKNGIHWIMDQHLAQPQPPGLFDRHVFDPQTTITAAEFIRRILNGEVNAPEGLEQALVSSKKG